MPEPFRVTFADEQTIDNKYEPISLPQPIYLTEFADPALELGEDFGIDPADAYYFSPGDEEEGLDTFGVDDPVLERIKVDISKNLRRESDSSDSTSVSDDGEEEHHVKQSDHYTQVPYGIQPKATYTHGKKNADIMGLVYNGKNRMFVILDGKGLTTWRRDITLDARIQRVLMYPKYEYRLISYIIYARKYDCYFALGKDFSLKVLNRDFMEICSVSADLRSVLFMLFNPAGDELITGGVGGTKIWEFKQDSSIPFTELKQLANYRLFHKRDLKDVGGSWVKRVDLDHNLQHLYCCSDTDLHVYDLSSTGKLLFKFERAHAMSITGCCYSQFAKCLVTCSVDSEVKVWSLQGTIAPVHTFRGHSRAVTGLVMHPDTSSIIITASMDGSVRMWSLITMETLYSTVITSDGILWMGLTDDHMLYCSTVRAITLWSLNQFYSFYAVARTNLTKLSLASCEGKSTRVVAEGEDSSVRLFARSNQKNLTTVLPPPNISPLEKIVSVCYSREFNVVFVLINTKEIWVYTTRTDPSCRVAVWHVHELQSPYHTKMGTDKDNPLGGWATSLQGGLAHRATENGLGNEVTSDCHSLCILNSTASMWTDEGFCCPIRHTYLLMGLEDGRILFMDPVIAGKKHMEFKASKDAIKEMKHDVAHESLITLCMLKSLAFIQVWSLPLLALQHEIYCALDLTCFTRLGGLFLTGHTSGEVTTHRLEPADDWGLLKAKGEPKAEDVLKEVKPDQREHAADVVALDSSATMKIFCSCSSNGVIRIWDENQLLLTEIFLDVSLSTACFLNEKADLIVGFKNHIFFISHTKVCPHLPVPETEEENYRESPILEDPSVLYEGGVFLPEPVTMENYLVPFSNIEFSEDFLEGNVDLEESESSDESSDTESQFTPAPSDIYRSPLESPNSLSHVDMLLDSNISKYDLRRQMEATMGILRKRVLEARKEKAERKNRLLRRRMRFLGLLKSPKRGKKEVDSGDEEGAYTSGGEEGEDTRFDFPSFGASPGPTPPPTPPTHPPTPEPVHVHEEEHPPEKEAKKEDHYVPPEEDSKDLFGHLPREPEVDYVPPKITSQKSSNQNLKNLSYPDVKKLSPASPAVKPRDPSPCLTPSETLHPSPAASRSTSPFPERPRTPETLISHPNTDVQSSQLPSKEGRVVEVPKELPKQPEKPPPKVEPSEEELPRRSKYGLAHIKVDVKSLMKAEQKKKVVRPPKKREPSPTRSEHTQNKEPEDNQLLTPQEIAKQREEEEKRLERMKKQMLKERKFPKRGDKPTRAQMLAEQKRQEELKKQHPYGIAPDIKLNLDKRAEKKNEEKPPESDLPMIHYEDMDKFEDDIWNDMGDTGVSKSGLMGTKLDLPPLRQGMAGKPGKLTIIKPPSRPQSRAQGGVTPVPGLDGLGLEPAFDFGKKEEVEKASEDAKTTEKLQGQVTSLKGIAEEQHRDGGTPDIETAVQRQWSNGQGERPRSETPSTAALKKLSETRKPIQKPITIILPKESDGKLDSYRDTPMADIMEEKSQHSGMEADDELTDEGHRKRKKRHGHAHPPTEKDAGLLTMEEKKYAQQRPFSSFVRRAAPATGSEVQRPKTAHVRFQAEDLQSAFEEALDRFHKLHGKAEEPEVLEEKEKFLHKNDGKDFEYNWQERVIERHMLLRMQKILRSRSAAQRRKAWEDQLNEKRQKLYQTAGSETDAQSNVAVTARSDSCMYVLNQVERANTVAGRPIPSESRQTIRVPPRRPRTAAANLQRQQVEKDLLKSEKPFRHRIGERPISQQSSRSVIHTKQPDPFIDPRIFDPRNPHSLRPQTSTSIPSKCTRYILISKPKQKSTVPLPSPLEEQLLAERFPQQGKKVYQHHTDLAAKAKKVSYTIEYTPFTQPVS